MLKMELHGFSKRSHKKLVLSTFSQYYVTWHNKQRMIWKKPFDWLMVLQRLYVDSVKLGRERTWLGSRYTKFGKRWSWPICILERGKPQLKNLSHENKQHDWDLKHLHLNSKKTSLQNYWHVNLIGQTT
jgi:hypothetical protein